MRPLKYIAVCVLFIFNNELLSMLAVCIMIIMFIIDFIKQAEEERAARRKEDDIARMIDEDMKTLTKEDLRRLVKVMYSRNQTLQHNSTINQIELNKLKKELKGRHK